MNALRNIKENINPKKIAYIIILLGILLLAFFIRWNNLKNYTTWWADDGGGHLEYVETILKHGRLPQVEDTYLAWHEPLYYLILSGWTKIGEIFGVGGLNWWEGFNIFMFFCFLGLVWYVSYGASKKDAWLALLNTFLFSILFSGVKLSAFVNDGVLAQALILLSIILFFHFQLLGEKKFRHVIIWSLIIGVAMLTKLTGIIVLLAACLFWVIISIKKRSFSILLYIVISLSIVFLANVPWLIHKNFTFGKIFSINLYEEEKQSIFTSPAWDYLLTFNPKIFGADPYWRNMPDSFASIFISDTFGDHYNLFNNVDQINSLSDSEKIETSNGRFTTPLLANSLRWANRVGLFFFLLWTLGCIGYIVQKYRNKEYDWYELFFLVVIVGGFGALVYNNLRHPYLERGVLKAGFIFFSLPLFSLFGFLFWKNLIKNRVIWFVVAWLPTIFYLIVAWPMLVI